MRAEEARAEHQPEPRPSVPLRKPGPAWAWPRGGVAMGGAWSRRGARPNSGSLNPRGGRICGVAGLEGVVSSQGAWPLGG